MSKKKTQEEFIEQAIAFHGDKFDYSLVKYNGFRYKVKIICPVHGVFEQTPCGHLKGGRRKCADSNKKARMSFGEFLEKITKIHGDKYIYGNFTKVSNKIRVLCKKHGVFEQVGTSSLQGHGCIKCHAENLSIARSMPYYEFVSKSNSVHDFKYTYTQRGYYNGNSIVDIFLPDTWNFQTNGGKAPRGLWLPDVWEDWF